MKNKLKMSLIFSTFYCFAGNFNLAAEDLFSLDDFSHTSYAQHYNTLSTVEDADKKVQSTPEFNQGLEEVGKVIVRYGLESYVGVRLNHKHFTVPEDTIMSENYEKVEDIPSLVTYAHTLEEAREKRALPSSWIFKTASLEDAQIFEASSDPAVREGIALIAHDPKFMEEMAEVLTANGFNSLLSLAILRRSSLEPTQDDELYAEVNYADVNKSVVQLWDSKRAENTIQTSWSFKGPRQQLCSRITVCDRSTLGHFHTWGHRKS